MEYKCSMCGKTNVKLWRDYNSFCITPTCAKCIMNENGKHVKIFNNGKSYWYWDGKYMGTGYELFGMVPAIPVIGEEDTFWGYTSVPQDRIAWWEQLPLR